MRRSNRALLVRLCVVVLGMFGFSRKLIHRFSLSIQKRRRCRFGKNRRLVLLLAWETLFLTIGALPVT